MKHTWRWFGPEDPVSLSDICQAGAQGVVTALHHIPPGQVWTAEEIARRQAELSRAPTPLDWSVVESLPVSEDIKRQSGPWRRHLDAWKDSLAALGAAGVQTVCYNFMPILDWTRTDLAHALPNGATCMRFDLIDYAVFDLFILDRPGAAADLPRATVDAAETRLSAMSVEDRDRLCANIVSGLPGAAAHFTLDDVRGQLALYDGIGADRLRQHLAAFLAEVAPVAQDLGLRLCAHPDDPPWPLLGLPRILSTEADYTAMRAAAPLPANGVTLCSGSLGADPRNDLPGMMQRLGPHVHFLHLRNVTREDGTVPGSFHEAAHLQGATDMVALIRAVLSEERRRRAEGRGDWQIPMRPDHGQAILSDLAAPHRPGYPAVGRLKGLAELRGIETALGHG